MNEFRFPVPVLTSGFGHALILFPRYRTVLLFHPNDKRSYLDDIISAITLDIGQYHCAFSDEMKHDILYRKIFHSA